jgi:hypothetical protein
MDQASARTLEAIASAQQRIEETQDRLEAMLDMLFEAVSQQEEPQPQRTLEGEDAGRERDQSQSLDGGDPAVTLPSLRSI